jgi:phosphoribosylanthranilate isomerase
MWIKICANTNLADAQLAADLGADAVGFVFAPSKRLVTAEQVAEITQSLPASIDKVGVFSTSDPSEIARIAIHTCLTAAQLHGPFEPSTVQTLAAKFDEKLKIIQTVPYDVDATDRDAADLRFEASLTHAFAEPALWAVLVDAAKSGASGGLGIAFDWARAAPILARVSATLHRPGANPRIILAGGLHAGNVAAAIAALRPWGVDVASGVEAIPGRKHPERLRQFLVAAR